MTTEAVEWKLFTRAVFTMASFEMGLVCAVFSWIAVAVFFLGLGMAVAGIALIVAAVQQYRALRKKIAVSA